MKFLKSKAFMLIIVAVISLVAIILVAYGVMNHEEPGLMGACWDETGETVTTYEVDGADACPEIRWEAAFPLTVGVRTANPHPPANPLETARHVVGRVNSRLGFEALRVDPEQPEECLDHHSICIEAEVPHEAGFMDAHGDAKHWEAPTGRYCTARTSNTGTAELFALVMEHELGHCLGLAHDSFEVSIMRAEQVPTPDRTIPPWISDFDRALLRGIYGEQ